MNLNQLPPPYRGIFRKKCGIALMVSLLFAGMINSITAQDEYIMGFDKKGPFSIARQLTSTKRVAYNRFNEPGGQTTGYNSFFIYEDGMTQGQPLDCIALPENLYVNDIFVRGSDVYFCGKRVLSNSQEEAVLGMFSATNFPSCSVYTFAPSGFSEFGMMIGYDMFENGSLSAPHIMMTAKRTNGEWTLVEGPTPSVGNNVTWEYDKMSAPANWALSGHVFQDMATTKDYILVTSSKRSEFLPSPNDRLKLYNQYVWYLPKPSNRQISTPFSGIKRIEYSFGVHDDVLLVNGCGDNQYVLVSDVSLPRICIDLCDGFQLTRRSYRNGSYELRDMKWNDHSQEMDVLVVDFNENRPHFWHLPLSLLRSPANGNAYEHVTKYSSLDCYTFDYIRGTDFFIGSGNGHFHAFKYKYNSWGNYFDRSTFLVEKVNYTDFPEVKSLIVRKIESSCTSTIQPTIIVTTYPAFN